MVTFYLLSLLSGFFEIAPFVLALRKGGVLAALLAALCYQLGNLAPCPLRLSRAAVNAAALAGSVCFAGYIVSGLFPMLCAGTAFISAAVQMTRSTGKADAAKALKRSLRVAGFGLGFFTAPLALPVAGFAAAAIVCSKSADARSGIVTPRLNIVNAAMIFHQVHYFSYCYAAIALAVVHAGLNTALGLFLLSWATYILGARLYRGHGLEASFFTGHTALTMMLLAMYWSPMSVKAALWVATGLGGTTEFCIARLAREHGGSADGGTFSENTGHVLGVALSAGVYAAAGDLTPTVLTAGAAALASIALMTAGLMTVKKRDSQGTASLEQGLGRSPKEVI